LLDLAIWRGDGPASREHPAAPDDRIVRLIEPDFSTKERE
jgi:hypothetical protein